jgi:hypothetical protein
MIQDIQQWAISTFGASKLGDKRRSNRLVKMACQLGENVGKSVVQSSGDSASIEGNYRLIRNPNISAQPIAESGFAATAKLAQNYNEILALEDTTTLTYSRENMEDKLGHTSSAPDSKRRGILVHSVLLYAPEQQHTIGLIEQKRWVRDSAEFGKSSEKKKRAYEDKESHKWEEASTAMRERLGDSMQNCISVCDREADIIEYMSYKSAHNQRFVVRAHYNRPLEEESRLYDYLTEQKKAGEYQFQVSQRGGRKGRWAKMDIKYAPVSVMAPQRKQKSYPPIELYAVSCTEIKSDTQENKSKVRKTPTNTLNWTLLTTEPVESAEQAMKIVSYYEARWKVELFHKVWKTQGTNVESLKMHQYQSLEKAAVILAFIACRLMQLKDMGENKD